MSASIEVAPAELGEALSAVRLCAPEAQQQMQLSLSTLGQLTPVQVYRVESRLETFDGLKRLRAARMLSWPKLRVEVHALDSAGAKVRLLRCNSAAGLSELEVAWLVRSLYRDDKLNQGQIARLLGRVDKSWVCRRLALAEGLSDEATANVRLGLLSVTACLELVRLQRCNQDAVAQVVMGRGLTTRQTARLVDALLGAPDSQWPRLLEQASQPAAPAGPKGGALRRTPGEQLVADAWAMKRLAARLHARLLERSLASLGDPACAVVSRELTELRATLGALTNTLDTRLDTQGTSHAS
ncbi:MAG: ParB/RepB/Spo0J family partition protein [Myxococcaceae bacterium]